MSKEVIVYWGCRKPEEFRAPEPRHVLSNYLRGKDKETYDYITCPGFLESMKNVYSIDSMYDFELDIVDGGIKTQHPPEFLQHLFIFRSPESRIVSVKADYYLFSEDPDLDITVGDAFFSQTEFTNNTIMIPGVMSISNWYRPLEAAFHLKDNETKLKVATGDPLMYVKFHTDKKIRFVKYEVTDELEAIMTKCTHTQDWKEKPNKLKWYYDLFVKHHLRKKILTKIKAAVY